MDIWDYDIIKIKNRNATVNHVPGTIGLRLIHSCRNHDTTAKRVLQDKMLQNVRELYPKTV